MKTIYLCGPINGCTDAEANDWRAYVKAKAPQFSYLDPMRRDYRGKEAESIDAIVTLDKIDIANSHVLLVNFDKPSVGTAMEVYIGFTTGKLVVIVTKLSTVISPWLWYHSHAIEYSFDDAIDSIEELLT